MNSPTGVPPSPAPIIRRQIIGCLVPLVIIAAVLVIMIVTSTSSAHPAAAPVSTAEPTRVPPMETLLSFGQKGMGVGQFEDANVVVPDNVGHIYISEWHGGRIQLFDAAGRFLNQWFVANPKPQTLITSLAADGKGNLFVATDDEI